MKQLSKSAYLFPGQGSQSVGMVNNLLKDYPVVSNLFDKASVILGYDLLEIVNNGPVDKLNNTIHAQPALLIAAYGLYLVHINKYAINPLFLAGHSLGEYTALVAGNAIDFSEAIYLVAKRAQYMQAAVAEGEGAMAAIIGLQDDEVVKLCEEAKSKVTAANYNAPLQVVISGEYQAVLSVMEAAKNAGAKLAKILPVSVPSHSPLMAKAAKQLAAHIDNSSIVMPNKLILSNVTANPYTSVTEIKDLLIQQLHQPVLWSKSIQYLVNQEVSLCIECGPGKVLAGLNKRISNKLTTVSGFDFAAIDQII